MCNSRSDPLLSTRDYNKQKRRKRILHAAKELLIAGGYDALTTRKLAEDAEVAKIIK